MTTFISGLLHFAITFSFLGAVTVSAQEALVGRSLAKVIESFRAAGLNVFYSSELVGDGLVVLTEPSTKDLAEQLEQVLAPHGLTTRPGLAGSLIVVRVPEKKSVGILVGFVLSASEGRPISEASVRVGDGNMIVTTDADGWFEFASVPDGSYRVEVDHESFRVQILTRVHVRAGSTTLLRLKLLPEHTFLGEIVVTPSAYSVKSQEPEPRQFLDRGEVERLPHLADDLFRVMPRLPGTVNADAYASFSIRGGFEDETLVLLDGLQLYNPYHFGSVVPVFSTVDSEVVGNMELMTGGFPAEYGDRLGGVLDIRSATSHGSPMTSVGASFITLRALSEGQLERGKGYWLFSARRGYLDWVLDLIDNGPEGEFSAGPTYYDLFAKVSYCFGSRHTLTGNIFASYDEMAFNGSADADWFDTKDGNAYFWLTFESDWNSELYSRTMASIGQVENRFFGEVFGNGLFETVVDSDRAMDVAGLKQDMTWTPSPNLFLKWGFDGRRMKADYDFEMDSIVWDPIVTGGGGFLPVHRQTDLIVDGTQLGLYAASRFRVADVLTAEVGVRWDHQSWTEDDAQISPRLNLIWDFKSAGTLRVAWGSYAQSQGVHELQVEDGITEFYPAQVAEHRVLSYERLLGPTYSLRVDAYSKSIDDVRPYFENLFDPMELFPPGSTDRVRIEPTSFDARGIEVLLKKNGFGRIDWWLSYVYAVAEDQIDNSWVPRTRDQRHAASFSVNWRAGDAWNINFAGIFHSGWARTPLEGEIVEAEDGSLSIRPVLGVRNSERLPSYARLDVRASRVFRLERSTIRFFVEITNLTNRTNPRSYSYEFAVNPDGGVDSTAVVDGRWLPLVPSFGVIWEF